MISLLTYAKKKNNPAIKKLIETQVPDYYQSKYLPSVYYLSVDQPIYDQLVKLHATIIPQNNFKFSEEHS